MLRRVLALIVLPAWTVGLGCSTSSGSEDSGSPGIDAAGSADSGPPFECEVASLDGQQYVALAGLNGQRPTLTLSELPAGTYALAADQAYGGFRPPDGGQRSRVRITVRGDQMLRATEFEDGGASVAAGSLRQVRPGYRIFESHCPVVDTQEFEFDFLDGGWLRVSASQNSLEIYEKIQ